MAWRPDDPTSNLGYGIVTLPRYSPGIAKVPWGEHKPLPIPFEKFLLALVNDLGVFALLTMGYGTLLRHLARGPLRFAGIGCLFGVGASFAMISGVEFPEGNLVDARGVMIVLSGAFGGPVAAVVTALIATVTRYLLGGSSMVLGIALVWLTAVISLVFVRVITPGGRPSKTRHFFQLGLFACLPSFALVCTSSAEGLARIALYILLPLFVAKIFGVVVLGRFLSSVRQFLITTQLLEHQAMLDPLTGLPNRRSLERNSTAIIDHAKRRDEFVAALVIDIDHFKRMNDRFGHDVGDEVLKKVAATVLSNLRAGDAAARYGGEEIVVLLPRTGLSVASRVAERIREAIGGESFLVNGETCGVTVSIGVAEHRGEGLNFKALFKAADEALYRAKDGGRDRVVGAHQMRVAA